LRHSESPDRRHLFDDHRVLSAGQVLGETEALAKLAARVLEIESEARGVGWGWQELQTLPQISTSSSNFAALFQKPVALPPQRPVPIFWRGFP
jgi:hypothetical protein